MSYFDNGDSGDDGGGGGGNPYYNPPSSSSSSSSLAFDTSAPLPLPTPTPVLDAPPPPASLTTPPFGGTPTVLADSALFGGGGPTSSGSGDLEVRRMEASLLVGAFVACLGFGVALFLARSFFRARSSSGAADARGRTGLLWALLVVLLLLLLGIKTIGDCVFVFYLFLHPTAYNIPHLLSVLLPALTTAVSSTSLATLGYSAFWLLAQPARPMSRRSAMSHKITGGIVAALGFLSAASAATGFVAAVKSWTITPSGARTWRISSLASAAASLAIILIFSAAAFPRWRLWAKRAMIHRRDTFVYDEKAGLRVPRTIEEAPKPRGLMEWLLGVLTLQSGVLALIAQGAALGLLACAQPGFEEWYWVPQVALPAVYLAMAMKWLTHYLVHPPTPAPANRGIGSVNAFLAPLDAGSDGRASPWDEKDRGMFGIGGAATPEVPAIYALYADGSSNSSTRGGMKGADLEAGYRHSGRTSPPQPALSINTALPVPPPMARQNSDGSVESGASSRNMSRWSGSTVSPKTAAKMFFGFKGGKKRQNSTPSPPLPSTSRTPSPEQGRQSPAGGAQVIGRPSDALVPPISVTRPVPARAITAPLPGGAGQRPWVPPNRQREVSRIEEEDEEESPKTALTVQSPDLGRSSYRSESDAWDLERFATSPIRELPAGVRKESFVPKPSPPLANRAALAAAVKQEERNKVRWAANVRESDAVPLPTKGTRFSAMSGVSSLSAYSTD